MTPEPTTPEPTTPEPASRRAPSRRPADHSDDAARPISVKIVVAGGFGVGKTTFVGAISEIEPLTTEAAMTEAAAGIDDRSAVEEKTTTTVAMDFGRITLDESLILYLFGTPGQDRFGFLWDDLAEGALGAIVLVDTARVEDCYAAVDYFERRGTRFVVAVNLFDDGQRFELDEVREALGVAEHITLVDTDCRDRERVKETLTALIRDLIAASAAAPAGQGV